MELATESVSLSFNNEMYREKDVVSRDEYIVYIFVGFLEKLL